MASGEVVGQVIRGLTPKTAWAQPSAVEGGSSPVEVLEVIDFSGSSSDVESYDFLCRLLSNYGGGGLTIKLPWTSAVNTNDVVWQAAIRRLALDSEDFDTSHTYDFNTVTDTAPGTIGHITEAQITFTDGSDMDSLAAGELFILRIKRDAGNASDSMTSDARLIPALLISET